MTAPLDAPGASKRLEGHCRCGAVRYDVADEFQYAMNCHCVDCRAATGAACKPIAGVEREKLSVVAGEDQIMLIGDELANDQRCARCGSFLFSVVRDGEWVHVGMGSLADAPSITPTHHIFVSQKAPWHEITDDLPQYERYRTD